MPQTVTITGRDDPYADGNIAYTIVIGEATSDDAVYDGLNPTDVSVTSLDSDTFTTTFTKTENANIPDRGTYTSSMAVAPTGASSTSMCESTSPMPGMKTSTYS